VDQERAAHVPPKLFRKGRRSRLLGLQCRNNCFVFKNDQALKERFGEANQPDKYRFELKSRRRRPNETLRSLHSDIRRLTALALSDLEHRARETMACYYFIDALNDPKIALKVRERFPKDLDTALRVAFQLEVRMSIRAPEESVGLER